jgi:hypothetical protein
MEWVAGFPWNHWPDWAGIRTMRLQDVIYEQNFGQSLVCRGSCFVQLGIHPALVLFALCQTISTWCLPMLTRMPPFSKQLRGTFERLVKNKKKMQTTNAKKNPYKTISSTLYTE